MSFDISHPEIQDVIRRALAEDIGKGDITTELCVGESARANGRVCARQSLTLAGPELLPPIFDLLAPGCCEVRLHHRSGARLKDGDEIACVRGPARTLLTAERTALNFLQHLSGVATLAAAYVQAIEGTGCRILDTRKTTPGLRRLEKMAAAAGGAVNHRKGLYDGILIKNNHITAAGGIRAALAKTQPSRIPIEIEVRTMEELDEALDCGAEHLLLDNASPAEAEIWITHIGGRAVVELSGGITLENVRAYAETGADYISSGALTHSAPAVDINFRLHLD